MSKKPEEFFTEGCNCAQSILAAYSRELGLDEKTALKIAQPFGGGVGRMRHICGALSGLLMLAGLKYGEDEPTREGKIKIYALTRKIAEDFKNKNSSIMCAEILAAARCKTDSSHIPQERNKEYYAKRPCLKVVENAKAIAENFLKNDDYFDF